MNALETIVTAIHSRENKEAGAALAVYRAAVQQLADNTPLDEKGEKKLTEAMEVLEIGTADLAADVTKFREHASLTAAVASSPDISKDYEAALAAAKHYEEVEVPRRRAELLGRVANLQAQGTASVSLQNSLRLLIRNNPRLFGVAEQAVVKPAPAKPPVAKPAPVKKAASVLPVPVISHAEYLDRPAGWRS